MTATLEHPVVESPPPPRSPEPVTESASGASVIVVRALYAFSALMVWALVYVLALGGVQESRSQTVMYAKFRQELATDTAPTGGAIPTGKPVALLKIPRFGIDDVVVEGTSSGNLLLGPGHRADSPLPGEVGVSVMYGRAATFGAPFRQIGHLHVGDPITVVDGAGTFHYVVKDIRHAGSPLPQPLAAGAARLTLASVQSSGWRSGWAPDAAVYVDASMQGEAAGEPGGRVGAVPSSDTLMGIDTGVLLWLVVLLQLFGLTAAMAAWAFTRWGRWQTWLVAVPTVGAALWLVSQTAVLLLPNVL